MRPRVDKRGFFGRFSWWSGKSELAWLAMKVKWKKEKKGHVTAIRGTPEPGSTFRLVFILKVIVIIVTISTVLHLTTRLVEHL